MGLLGHDTVKKGWQPGGGGGQRVKQQVGGGGGGQHERQMAAEAADVEDAATALQLTSVPIKMRARAQDERLQPAHDFGNNGDSHYSGAFECLRNCHTMSFNAVNVQRDAAAAGAVTCCRYSTVRRCDGIVTPLPSRVLAWP